MKDEKSTLQILKDFAEQSGRNIKVLEEPHSSTSLHPVTYHSRKVCIPNNKKQTSYFLYYQEPKDVSEYAMFSGVFIPIYLPSSIKIKIRKKDLLDRVNPFLKKKIYETGNQNFDSQVVITGNDKVSIKRIFGNINIQNYVLKAFEIIEGLTIAVNEVKLNFVPGFESESNLGIFSSHEWILDKYTIESLFELIEELRREIKS